MARKNKVGVIDITKATKVFERAFRDVDPESMKDISLTEELRFAHWVMIVLRDLPSDHILVSLGPVAEVHRNRLWEEYKKRFGQGDSWPAPPGKPKSKGGWFTASGYRKACCDPEKIRKEALRELRSDLDMDPTFCNAGDPVMTLQFMELTQGKRERIALVRAEIARRERRRKAA